MYLGIDAGGTHTDAVIIDKGRVLCSAKVPTLHHDLPSSLRAALAAIKGQVDVQGVRRVTLGTTLAVNALVQGKGDAVGLALAAGPGMDAARFALGEHVHIVPGGLDHRGVEVTPLSTQSLAQAARGWHEAGVRCFAVASKFSPRNPAHEKAMAAILAPLGHVTQGHELSGLLNFPRRLAGAYFNAAVWRLHNTFLDAVEEALAEACIHAPIFLLKADGGAAPLGWSRRYPVESILSGPAASVMGVLALGNASQGGDSLLLDMGGTTTDIALYAGGCPVLERDGMRLPYKGQMHKTHTRALATISLGVGGDSALHVTEEGHGEGAGEGKGRWRVIVGPQRQGPAMAFGGTEPTLLDALNVLGLEGKSGGAVESTAGDSAASLRGMARLAGEKGVDTVELAALALQNACGQIRQGFMELLTHVNGHPVYTLAELLEGRQLCPAHAWLVGGPALLVRKALEEALSMPVRVPSGAATANAVGAALTLPTAQLDFFADTTQGLWRAPALEEEGTTGKRFSLQDAQEKAVQLLRQQQKNMGGCQPFTGDGEQALQPVDVLEADIFATLDDRGHGGRDIRVRCQLRPGIVCGVEG